MEEIVYYVACPRKDYKKPKLAKACDEIFFLDKERAVKLCIEISNDLKVEHKVFTAKVSI